MNDGISLMQPPHLVAQRSNKRALPLKLDSGTDLPAASSNTKSGAGLRADCGSTATRISAARASDNAARQTITVRIGPLNLQLFTILAADRVRNTSTSQTNKN